MLQRIEQALRKDDRVVVFDVARAMLEVRPDPEDCLAGLTLPARFDNAPKLPAEIGIFDIFGSH